MIVVRNKRSRIRQITGLRHERLDVEWLRDADMPSVVHLEPKPDWPTWLRKRLAATKLRK